MPPFEELGTYCFCTCLSLRLSPVCRKASMIDNWRTLGPIYLKLGREVVHHQQTTYIDIGVSGQDHTDQKVAHYLKIASQTITNYLSFPVIHILSFAYSCQHFARGGGRHNVVKDLLLNYVYVTGDRQFRHSIHMFHHQSLLLLSSI